MSEVRLPRALINELVPGTNTLKDRGRLSPVKVSPTLNYDSLSTVSIQLKESDIELGQHEFVDVYGEFGSLGIFRVVSRSKKIKGIYTYNLNHAFDTLSDCVIEGVDTISGSVSEIISRLLQCQKEGIGNQKYWQLGTVQCPYSYTFDNSYDNVYDTLKDIADKYSDCCFTFDFSTFPWTLNFVNKSDEIVSELRLDRNIDEIEISENDNEQCTMLHLSVDTRDDPSVAEDAQDVTYRTITDAEAVANWGIIEKAIGIETKEIGGASEEAIQAWIDRFMSEHKNPELSIEITGEEYAKHTGEPMDRLQLGKICRTILKKYNTVFFERIVSINYPDILKTPRHFKATLASKKLTAGGAIAKMNKEQKKSSRTGGKRLQQASDYLEDYLDYLGHYIEENDQHWKSVYWDTYHGLTSRIEQTAAYWQAEFDDQYNQLHGFIDITAQHWQATYEDGYNQLWSQVEQTAAYWRSSLADTYNGLYGMVEQTAAYWRSSLADTYNGLSSRVEQTAAYWRSSLAEAYAGLSSRVTQTARSWEAKISGVADASGNVTAASIAVAINNAGESEARIDADKVYIGNQKSTTVISGKLNASDVTTDYLKAKIAAIPKIDMLDAYASSLRVGGQITLRNGLYLDANAVWQVNLTQSGNTYTLKELKLNGDERTIGSFSRATILTGTWSSGVFTVKASPQGNQVSAGIMDVPKADITWSNRVASFPVKANRDGGESVQNTGKTLRIDAGDVFELVDITLQGSSVQAYEKLSSGGDIYYKAGSAKTYYNAGSGSVTGRGDGVSAYEKLSSGGDIYYKAGSAVTRYKGNGGSFTVQGAAGPKLYYAYSQKTLYQKNSNGTFSSVGTHNWYYTSSSGTQYYRAGTTTKIDRGDSVSVTPIQATTAIRINSTAQTLYKGNGSTVTPQGSAVGVTPIQATTAIRINSTAKTLYNAGTRYNKNTYYQYTGS